MILQSLIQSRKHQQNAALVLHGHGAKVATGQDSTPSWLASFSPGVCSSLEDHRSRAMAQQAKCLSQTLTGFSLDWSTRQTMSASVAKTSHCCWWKATLPRHLHSITPNGPNCTLSIVVHDVLFCEWYPRHLTFLMHAWEQYCCSGTIFFLEQNSRCHTLHAVFFFFLFFFFFWNCPRIGFFFHPTFVIVMEDLGKRLKQQFSKGGAYAVKLELLVCS